MSGIKVFRWICIILLSGLCLFFGSAFLWNLYVYQRADSFHGVPADVDWGPEDLGMSYGNTIGYLGNTKFVVETAGSRRDSARGPEWHFYGISILKEEQDPYWGTTCEPFFGRWFDANEVPANFLEMKLNEIIEFDEETRTAQISVGTNQYTVILPPRER